MEVNAIAAGPNRETIGADSSPREGDVGADYPRLDGYRILRRLGHGGQGHVFLAVRLSDNSKAAIKFILPSRLDDLASRARFEDEGRLLQLLNHPAIVRILDHGTLDSGELWLATEYIDGVPVNQYVHDLDRVALAQAGSSARSAFPMEKVLELFVRICRGVEAAHQAGVLHRDLKPANILVGADGQPHILDFGLARSTQREGPDAVTLTGMFMGSPIWCSPEQMEARPSLIDVRTDVYSIGMMLYHALTGDFPFDIDQPWPQLFETIRNAEPKPLRAIRSFIDADLETLVLTAIAREKDRRYASVTALREDIERYQAGLPIGARADTRFYRLRKFVRRNRLLVASISAVALLTVGYAVSVTVLFRRAEHHAADARAKFRAARDMLDFTLSQVDSALAELPGAATTRRQLLEKAYAQLDAFLQEKTDDPELQADIAKTRARLADIAQSLGRWDRAADEVAAALEIRRKLAAQTPGDAEAQAELSIALVRVGDIACGRGDRRLGLAHYEQALRIDEALVAADPQNVRWLDNLNWSYDRLCSAAIFDGDDPRAAGYYEKRLRLAQRLFELNPTSPARIRCLLGAHLLGASIMGPFAEGSEHLSKLERAERAGRLASELIALDANNVDYQRQFVVARQFQANVLADEGRLDEASRLLREAQALIERVLRVEPEDREWITFRVTTLCAAGRYARWSGQLAEAESLLRQAVAQAETLAARQPEDVQLAHLMNDTRDWLAGLLWESGQHDESRDLYAALVEVWRSAVTDASATPDQYRRLADLLLRCPAAELRDPAESLEVACRGVERTQGRSVQLLALLAAALQANGQLAEARTTAAQALALTHASPSPLRAELEGLLAALPAP